MYKKFTIVFLLMLFSFSLKADETAQEKIKEEVQIDVDRVSETLGHLLIKQLNNPVFAFNVDKIIAGMKAAMAGQNAPLSEEAYEEQIMAIQEKIFQKTAEKNLSEAVAFLEKNKKESQVVCINDQLQYKILQVGEEGGEVGADSSPLVHYTGKMLDGKVFASSKESGNPITLSLKDTIMGFNKGLIGMKKGETRVLYIHPDLAYGMGSHLPPNSLLIFEVEIVELQHSIAKSDEELQIENTE
jgi:peptidylprolyl isomerase